MPIVKEEKPKKALTATKATKQALEPKTAKAPVKSTGLTVQVVDIRGKAQGTITLPKEIFGQTPNKKLIDQAFRVYEANAKSHTSNTKTRGEVRGGGAKPWRQKGTGRARAGSNRSPLWVGGGITFGPRYKDVKLELPKKMRQKALTHALSQKSADGQIKVVANFEKIEPKTKVVSQFLKNLNSKGASMFVISEKNQNVKLATRNIQDVYVNTTVALNAYNVLTTRNLYFTKEAIAKLS